MARITRRDLDTIIDVATGQLHKFTLKEFFGHVLEVDSVHFHFNSAVLLPNNEPPDPGDDAPPSVGDPEDGEEEEAEEASGDGEDEGPSETDLAAPGLAILRAIYVHAADNPSQKLLITGHTDRSGSDASNVELSFKRAENVKHALLGNRDEGSGATHHVLIDVGVGNSIERCELQRAKESADQKHQDNHQVRGRG